MAESVVQALVVVMTILIFCSETIFAHPWKSSNTSRQPDYSSRRQYLLMKEKQEALGGDLKLNPIEVKANEILMTAKIREIDDAFATDDSFLPSRNFMSVISKIEESEVFKILRDLPKGGVLHTHVSAMVSLDYKFNNLTYRDNLYVCDENGTFMLKFFDVPDDQCDWRLLSDLRQKPDQAKTINEKILRHMTMVVEDPNSVYKTADDAWHKFDILFNFMDTWMFYRPIYEDYIYQALQELYDDNVMYVEVRSGLSTMYDLDGTWYKPAEVMRLNKEVSERFVKDHPDFIGAKFIYSRTRSSIDGQKVDEYINTMIELKELYPDYVVGFDLVGREDTGKTLIEVADSLNAVNRNIQYFFHAGETNWNGGPIDLNIIDAVLLKTKRIGHGYALMKHPVLWNIIKQCGIAVEICPISNQILGLVRDMRNHPATSLFALGFPVVVSNDDPGLWGAKGLTYDFYEAFMALMSASSDLRSLKQLAINSLVYSGLNNKEKKEALRRWQQKWHVFVNKLARSSSCIVVQ